VKNSVKIGEHTIRLWVITALLISVICVGVLADYIWKNIIIPVEVKEPLEIVSYPSKLTLFPGERKEFNVTIMNCASRNYAVILDFALDNVTYQDSYVTFSNESYTVIPGQQNLTAWLKVQPNAPPTNASLTIDFWRITELSDLTRTKSIIEVGAEGGVLHYQNESFWAEDQFSKILEYKAQFTSNIINQLNETLSIYGERNEYAVDAKVEFNQTRKSTILKCDIHGAMTSSDRYTFRWLLDPSGLDFIINDFQQSENELFWEGSINGIPTTITLTFPFPIAHCHAHVWRK
jgi:hypothetical protein